VWEPRFVSARSNPQRGRAPRGAPRQDDLHSSEGSRLRDTAKAEGRPPKWPVGAEARRSRWHARTRADANSSPDVAADRLLAVPHNVPVRAGGRISRERERPDRRATRREARIGMANTRIGVVNAEIGVVNTAAGGVTGPGAKRPQRGGSPVPGRCPRRARSARSRSRLGVSLG
jgi:hypothetical protein